jgi:hypothetical protein
MKPDTVLTIGEFEFSGTEIPERIPFGGRQTLKVHQLVGGARVVDAMGKEDDPLAWSGIMNGQNALLRARYLKSLCNSGQAVPLFWSQLAYNVIIDRFDPVYELFHRIPYSISCTVVSDYNYPVTQIAPAGVDDAIRADMTSAMGLGDLIGDGPLSAALGTLNSAISAVSNFATATQSMINGVLAPLAAVQARVGILTSSLGNTIASVTTLGGVLPNNPISQIASRLTNQVVAMNQLPQLYSLGSVLGRMGGNLGTIGGGANIVATAGGNLFSMAEKAYGDITAWTGIAKANSLVDPQIAGLANIVIPAVKDLTGGILSA